MNNDTREIQEIRANCFIEKVRDLLDDVKDAIADTVNDELGTGDLSSQLRRHLIDAVDNCADPDIDLYEEYEDLVIERIAARDVANAGRAIREGNNAVQNMANVASTGTNVASTGANVASASERRVIINGRVIPVQVRPAANTGNNSGNNAGAPVANPGNAVANPGNNVGNTAINSGNAVANPGNNLAEEILNALRNVGITVQPGNNRSNVNLTPSNPSVNLDVDDEDDDEEEEQVINAGVGRPATMPGTVRTVLNSNVNVVSPGILSVAGNVPGTQGFTFANVDRVSRASTCGNCGFALASESDDHCPACRKRLIGKRFITIS